MKPIYTLWVLALLAPDLRAGTPDCFLELYGTNGFYAGPEVPQAAIVALKEIQKKEMEIRSFAFSAAGDWVALYPNHFLPSSQALPAYTKLWEMQQNKDDIKCVALAPTGVWTVVQNWNGYWVSGGGLVWNKIREIGGTGCEIRSVAYGPADSWVILYDKTQVAYSGIPDELARILDNTVSNRVEILCVAFSGRDWICLGHDQWWTSNPKLPAAKIIDQHFKSGLHPKWIALVPSLGPFNADRFGASIREALTGKLAGGYQCEAIADGRIVTALAEGWARAPWEKVNPAVPMTVNKPMYLCSVSKTVKAVALLKLWEECTGSSRRFSLDDAFWRYLSGLYPEVHEDVKKVTIRQVLTHRGGFTNDFGSNPAGLKRLLSLPLPHAPGTFFSYNNVNYAIVNLLIEQLSQISAETYIKTHVLAPMGIADMETHSEGQQRTCTYGLPGDLDSGDEGFKDYFGGSWYGTAASMGKFLEGIRQCTVLSPATRAMMLTEKLGWDDNNPSIKVGLLPYRRGNTHTAIAYFPDGVEAVLLVNCELPEQLSPQGVLIKAWKQAHN